MLHFPHALAQLTPFRQHILESAAIIITLDSLPVLLALVVFVPAQAGLLLAGPQLSLFHMCHTLAYDSLFSPGLMKQLWLFPVSVYWVWES